jgi:hypothetical protein
MYERENTRKDKGLSNVIAAMFILIIIATLVLPRLDGDSVKKRYT